MKTIMFFLALCVAGCVSLPEGIEPVDDFELHRYLGRWYEIARLDHSFERGLTHVTADYSLREDGGVRVVNRGYSTEQGAWTQAEGRAYFVDNPDRGFLKVSFFGPFYGSYVIFDLDRENYSWALVSGPDRSYLWLLARAPQIDPSLKEKLIQKAAEQGFETQTLIIVPQSDPPK